MDELLIWDETKRKANLLKHGLDFKQAHWVLSSRYRLDVQVLRGDELRTQSFAYVLDELAVLTVVHTEREEAARVISFRSASQFECEAYYEWLKNDA